jgi:glycosyltransferase involved in cell wall biosynthesis
MTTETTTDAAVSAGAATLQPPRLLCLAPQEPWPATDGGKEGIHGAVQALSARARILLACPGEPADDATDAHFRGLGVEYRPVGFQPRESLKVVMSATLQLKPYKFHKYGTSQAEELFDAAIGAWRPDAILCFHAHMEELAQRLKRRRGWGVPVLVREHNIEYEMVVSYLAARPAWQRWVGAPIAWLTRRAEERMWQRVDLTAFLSDRDFAIARRSGVRGNLVLAPEGVPIPPVRVASRPTGRPRLLIPLNRKAPQSVANVRIFLHDYWAPAAHGADLAGVDLVITGVDAGQLAELTSITPEEQVRLRIHATGFLPSLLPAFESALALVAPTFVGSGIRKKILEGMANQVPVIATDFDIQTCDYFKDGDNIVRLGSASDFSSSVRRLIEDASLWHRLSANGRRTVERHADWGRFADALLSALADVRDARARPLHKAGAS